LERDGRRGRLVAGLTRGFRNASIPLSRSKATSTTCHLEACCSASSFSSSGRIAAALGHSPAHRSGGSGETDALARGRAVRARTPGRREGSGQGGGRIRDPAAGRGRVTGWWDWVRFGSVTETATASPGLPEPLETLRPRVSSPRLTCPPPGALQSVAATRSATRSRGWCRAIRANPSLLTLLPLLIAVGATLRDRLNLVPGGGDPDRHPGLPLYGGGGADHIRLSICDGLRAVPARAGGDRHARSIRNLEAGSDRLSLFFVCYGYAWQVWK